jgi:hypothetical protein
VCEHHSLSMDPSIPCISQAWKGGDLKEQPYENTRVGPKKEKKCSVRKIIFCTGLTRAGNAG